MQPPPRSATLPQRVRAWLPNPQTIRFRLLALALLLIALGILLRQFVAIPMIERRVQQLADTQQLSIASYIAQNIDYDISARLTLIDRYAKDVTPGLISTPEALQAWVRERERINTSFDAGLLVVDANGRDIVPTAPAGTEPRNFSRERWFVAAVRANGGVLGAPQTRGPDMPAVIAFAAPIRDTTGTVIAVLAGSTSLHAPGFLGHLQTARLGDSGGFLLVSPQDHLFVAASDPTMVMRPTPPTGVNLLHDRAMAGYRGVGVTINARGVEELSAMATVPATGWFVVARMPTAEALQPVIAVRGFILVANSLLALLLLVVLLVLLPRILNPLTRAATSIREMADGKTELKQLGVTRDDEVGELVRGFNVLVSRLKNEEVARQATEARLQFMAHHDSLTGLYNRATLEDRLAHALALSTQDGTQLALLFCDLDGFKAINDRHGHEVGDTVLRQVAGRLTGTRRRTDTVARLGGDEFVILLPGLQDARGIAIDVAQRCLRDIADPFLVQGQALTLGISIGIALHTGPPFEASRLMVKADAAMYQAKRDRKGWFVFSDDGAQPSG